MEIVEKLRCSECGAITTVRDAEFHQNWHEHLERMFDAVAGENHPFSQNVSDAVRRFKRSLGVK